jgi:O-antigen/teichoic acid export membrane protein
MRRKDLLVLFRNTFAQSAARLVAYTASLLLAPLMLSRLGLAQFGVWAVTGAVATYAYLLDFGVGRALSRFVALYDASGDPSKIRECVGLGLLVVTGVGAASCAVAAFAAPLVADILGVLTAGEMRIVLLSSLLLATSIAYGQVLRAVAIGMRRMVPPAVASVTVTLINFSFSVVALLLSTELVDYAVANAAAGIVGLVPSYMSMRWVWSGQFAALPSRGLVKEVARYGLNAQVNWLADLVNLQTDKIVIALLLDVRVAGAYEIGSRAALAVRSAGVMVLSAMIPTATALIVEQGREAVPAFYRRYLGYSVALTFPLFVGVAITAPFLLAVWLGELPPNSVGVLTLLTAASFINITTGVAMTVSMGAGEAGFVARYSVPPAVLNILFTLLLTPFFGLWGVLAGTVIGWSIGSLLFVRRFGQLHGIPFRTFLDAVLPPAVISLGLAAPFAVWYALGGNAPDERLAALPGLLAIGGPYALAYWVVASRRGLLPSRLALPWWRREQVELSAP